MLSSTQKKFFSVTLASQKVGLSIVAPCHSPLLKLIITKKSNKYVIVPSKKFFSVTLASQKVGLSTVAPCHSPLLKLIITKKSNKYVIVPSKKIFLRDARLSKSGSLDSRPVPLASIEVDNHEKIK